MFIDRVQLTLSAGKGGNGVIAWRREKYIPKGGPTGGNGGRGGSVIVCASKDEYSLERLRNHRILRAENGRQGGGNQRQGRGGKKLIVPVPLGTLIKDAETNEIIADLKEDGEKIVLCEGGRGGRGNASFKSPTNRAPVKCTLGTVGETKEVELELKLIADVGLIGFPNAGKSTLLQTLTNVRVKIGAYPFTTLRPNLGIIKVPDFGKLFVADIPGIIENAYLNRGLGLEFLRHIERTKVLLYVLDASGIDGRTAWDDWTMLRNELKNYNEELLNRPHFILLNKIDSPDAEEQIAQFRKHYQEDPSRLFEICAPLAEGTDSVKQSIIEFLIYRM